MQPGALICVVFFTIVIIPICTSLSKEERMENHTIVMIPDFYKKNQPPVPPNSSLNLHIEIYIWSITEISAKKMEMSVDTFVEFRWKDYRIKAREERRNETARIPLSVHAVNLWTPIVQFRNCKGCEPLLFDAKKQNLYYVPKENTLWTSKRILTKFSCTIILRSFPMDKQMCRIQLESYFEELKDIKFIHGFDHKHKRIASNESLSEFEFDAITVGDCVVPTYDGKLYACIELQVHFFRRLGYYIMTIYAPTICIVILSWISFWLPVDISPARITLGVTSLLTLATRLDQTQNNLPAVSYIKAIDAWMFACIFLVFASLLEFAIANYTWRISIQKANAAQAQVNRREVATAVLNSKVRPERKTEEKTEKSSACCLFGLDQRAPNLDKICRIMFPAAFIIFNIIYWSYYLA